MLWISAYVADGELSGIGPKHTYRQTNKENVHRIYVYIDLFYKFFFNYLPSNAGLEKKNRYVRERGSESQSAAFSSRVETFAYLIFCKL